MKAYFLIGVLVTIGACRFDFDEPANSEKQCSDNAKVAEECCGCWDGTQCLPGDSPNACGVKGGACGVCAEPTGACEQGGCVAERAIVSLGLGTTHTCAADRQYTLWCWGANKVGQAAKDDLTKDQPTPYATSTGEWAEVASGGGPDTSSGVDTSHSCAVHQQRSVWCWGDNSKGQLGTDNGNPFETDPTLIGEEKWDHVTAGNGFSCAIQEGGTLWCWGEGGLGQLGSPAPTNPKPLRVGVDSNWDKLDAGGAHACALKQEGDASLWCWGDNAKGQLGRPDLSPSDRPILVDTGYIAVSAGGTHTCAIRTDRSLWCWGDNERGQLGIAASTPVTVPTQIGTDKNWSAIAAGSSHTCGLRDDATLWCWGDNNHGQVGIGTTSEIEPLTLVPGRTDWSKLVSGSDHLCAITSQGLLFCWGLSASYQTGLNVTTDVKSPTALTLKVP